MGEPEHGMSAIGPDGQRAAAAQSVTAVVVTHNEGDMLRRTVESFLSSSEPPDEIVVVDDCSTDESTKFLRHGFDTVTLVTTRQQQGISRARNLGGTQAKGDVVVFSDAHVEVQDGWRLPLVEALSDSTVGEVAPGVGYLDDRAGVGFGFTWRSPSMKMAWIEQKPAENTDVPFLCGCFVALRRDVFLATGGFDPGLYRWGFEDSELSLRLWLSGLRCRVVTDSLVRHHFREQFPYTVHQAGVIYNALRMATVHFDELAIERVIAHFGEDPAFGQAWSMLLDSDSWERRDSVREERCRELRWFLERFGIDALG
jgi:glycosyltransferase involved in cell wall biosynthesis